MTLLSVVQGVCAAVGVAVPSSVFSGIAGNRTMVEMLALANEMAQRISWDTRDWTKFRAQQVFTGDGTKTAWDLPADYRRMLLTSNVFRSTNYISPMRFVPDTDEWMQRRARNIYDALGEWTMLGGQMLIVPALTVGETAYFPYLKRNCVALASGGFGDSFLSDNDTFALDERLLKLGMTWQWKAQKGSPYSEDLSNYGDALTTLMGHDSPAPILIGRRPMSLATKTAYPYPVPTGGG